MRVGVDNGGTWIRFVGQDAGGKRVWTLKKPSPPVEQLPGFLKKHLRRFKGRLEILAVGSRGVWKPAKRKAVQRALYGLAKKVIVMSDVEAAWLAAFGPHPPFGHPLPHEGEGWGEGIIIISGTGSIAYGRRADGTSARAGGLGPDKGDEGSGYWIGREWLSSSSRRKRHTTGVRRLCGEPEPSTASIRDIASLAPAIIRKAQKGNPRACEVIHAAQTHLSDLVIELRRTLSWKGTIPLAISGSVLENPWLQRGFLQALRRNHVDYRLTRKKADQAIAALSGLALPLHRDSK